MHATQVRVLIARLWLAPTARACAAFVLNKLHLMWLFMRQAIFLPTCGQQGWSLSQVLPGQVSLGQSSYHVAVKLK